MAKSFLVIKNQKESKVVYDLLCKNGYVAGENLFIAEKLEDMKSSDFDKYVENHSYLVGNHGYDAFLSVYNITHIYSNATETFLEQVAKIIGVKLDAKQQFFAETIKGFKKAKEYADYLGMREKEFNLMYEDAKEAQRRSLGVTKEEDEAIAVALLNSSKNELFGKLTVVDLSNIDVPHMECVEDQMLGRYDNMLVIRDGILNFYGASYLCYALKLLDRKVLDDKDEDYSIKAVLTGTDSVELTCTTPDDALKLLKNLLSIRVISTYPYVGKREYIKWEENNKKIDNHYLSSWDDESIISLLNNIVSREYDTIFVKYSLKNFNLLNKLNIHFTVVMPKDGDKELFNIMENRARRHYEADEFDHSIIKAVAPRATIIDIDAEHPYLTDVLE